jgi:hypothetical protein
MFEAQRPKSPELPQDNQQPAEMEALVGFFELLLAVDRRINPQICD